MEHIAELSGQIASLKVRLEQARRGAAPNNAAVLNSTATHAVDVPPNGTARASPGQADGVDVVDAPGPSNIAGRVSAQHGVKTIGLRPILKKELT